ncbi:pentapeptide repeat-containing protein [Streptomyces cocklensis]|uniref:pentapeptide repeat-containing protein n=1 Tax=Actinacidiphila cocklensis TaxID=887465 RepID=UPI00203CCC5D|nr:pentapeptide repeat-containing protein [Actinacidiphila cocklensis]MDD1063322.1 pentapeptide repeat-containing protein [Actinacidiphila cocklensis]
MEALSVEVLEALRRGTDLHGLSSLNIAGRLDLRNIRLGGEENDQGAGIDVLPGAIVSDVDFSGAEAPGVRLVGTRVVNCVFEKANLDGLEARATNFVGCSFAGASLRGAQLSIPLNDRYSLYEDVDFSRAMLYGASCVDASFKRCVFSGVKMGAMSFRGSDFLDCSFSGALRRVVFSDDSLTGRVLPGPVMQNVDFSDAVLRDVEFRGIDLNGVSLPEGDPHIVVKHYRCVLGRILDRLPVSGQPFTYGLRAYLAAELGHSHPARGLGIWHRASLGKTPEEQEYAIRLLRACERECEGDG